MAESLDKEFCSQTRRVGESGDYRDYSRRRGTRWRYPDLNVSHMRPVVPLVLAAALVVAGCAARTESLAPGPVGCWESNRPTLGTFTLDYDEVTGEPRFSPNAWGDFPISNDWMPLSTEDSVRINYGYGGFSGETVRARVVGDSLVGVTLPFTDAVGGPSPKELGFVARRVACSIVDAGAI